MVVGYHHFRKPPYMNRLWLIWCILSWTHGMGKRGLETKMQQSHCSTEKAIVLIPWNLSLYCSTSFCEDLLISISSLHRWYLKRFGVWLVAGRGRDMIKGTLLNARCVQISMSMPSDFQKPALNSQFFFVGMTFPETMHNMHTPLTFSRYHPE